MIHKGPVFESVVAGAQGVLDPLIGAAMAMSNGWAEFKGFDKYQFNDLQTWVPDEEQVAFDGTLDEKGEASFTFTPRLCTRAASFVQKSLPPPSGGRRRIER